MKFNFNHFFRLVVLFAITFAPHAVGMQAEVAIQTHGSADINWSSWRDMLLNSPREALTRAHETKLKWLACCVDGGEAAYQECLRECPFFMLDECGEISCSLHRDLGYRETFEQKVSEELVKKIDGKPNEFVYYVGFGAGYLFSDFLIFVRTLTVRPRAKILLSAIDLIYDDQHIVRKDEHPHFMEYGALQFAGCLIEMFPRATLELRLIGNHREGPEKLVEALEQKQDIVVTSDISGIPLGGVGTVDYFKSFMSALLKKDSSVINFWLRRVTGTPQAAIFAYGCISGAIDEKILATIEPKVSK